MSLYAEPNRIYRKKYGQQNCTKISNHKHNVQPLNTGTGQIINVNCIQCRDAIDLLL